MQCKINQQFLQCEHRIAPNLLSQTHQRKRGQLSLFLFFIYPVKAAHETYLSTQLLTQSSLLHEGTESGLQSGLTAQGSLVEGAGRAAVELRVGAPGGHLRMLTRIWRDEVASLRKRKEIFRWALEQNPALPWSLSHFPSPSQLFSLAFPPGCP